MSNVNTKSNVNEVTNKTSNSLMKKTKAQLVEIILRKDEVERNLRKDINELCDSLDKIKSEKELLENKFEILKNKFETLQNDYREEYDENAYYIQELKDKIERYKMLFYGFFAMSIALIAYSIVFFK